MLASCSFLLWASLLQTPQTSPAWLTPDQQAVFALLDAFDPLDTGSLPFVRVATGRGFRLGDQPPQNTYRCGFLLHSTGAQFTVRYLEFDRAQLTSSPRGTPEYLRVGFAPHDLAAYAAEFAAARQRQAPRANPLDWYRSPDAPFPPSVVTMLLARACARGGLRQQVQLLWDPFDSSPRGGPLSANSPLNLELAAALATRLALDFGDTRFSWQDLLRRHDLWLQHFPASPFRDSVVKSRESLAAMPADDAALAERLAATPQDLGLLVQNLRNACRPAWSGGFDTSPVEPPEPPPAAARQAFDGVVGRGLEIVPALIAALDAEGPTRSVLYCSRFGGGFMPRTLGDVAADALGEIAGVSLGREEWSAWYQAARRDGVRRTLCAHLTDPRGVGAEAAFGYLQRWPDDLEPVLAVARAADLQTRADLLRAITWSLTQRHADLPAPIAELLRAELLGGPERLMQASRQLLQFGDRGGVRVMMEVWRDGQVPDVDRLQFLLSSGVPAVWTQLRAGIGDAALRGIFAAVMHLLDRTELLQQVEPTDMDAVQRSLRACLFALLADDAPFGDGVEVVVGDRRIGLHQATRADIAASVLASLWPDEYPFEAACTASLRRSQIEAMLQGKRSSPPVPKSAATDVLGGIDLDASAQQLPADVRRMLQAMSGKAVAGDALLQVLLAAAKSEACRGKRVVLELERTGNGQPATLRCLLQAHASQGRTDFDLSATVAGFCVRGGVVLSSSRIDSLAELQDQREDMDRLRFVLQSDPTSPLELTLGLQLH